MEKKYADIINEGKKNGESIEVINTKLKEAGANFHLNPDGGTAGFGESEAYFQKVLDRVKESIDESNSIIGTYMCQGKMPMAVRERYEKMKQQPNPAPNLDGLIRNFDRALAHPDDHDLEELKQAVRRGEDS